jgi:hypothetical protein
MRNLVWLFVLACSKPSAVSEPTTRSSPALNALMNEHVNPAFSKLSFLVFHADTMEDPDAARGALASTARELAAATTQLRTWDDPPVLSREGRDVFQTYSASVDGYAQKLVAAVASGDDGASRHALEQIAETCNNCHHFFRLKIEDSVVGAPRR